VHGGASERVGISRGHPDDRRCGGRSRRRRAPRRTVGIQPLRGGTRGRGPNPTGAGREGPLECDLGGEPGDTAATGRLGLSLREATIELCPPAAHRMGRCARLAGLSCGSRGGGGNRTPVPGRPFGTSPGAAGGKISPRGSRRRRTSRPARVRCPAAAPGRSHLREPAHDARPPVAGGPEGTAT
jgi:hypothetical protein